MFGQKKKLDALKAEQADKLAALEAENQQKIDDLKAEHQQALTALGERKDEQQADALTEQQAALTAQFQEGIQLLTDAAKQLNVPEAVPEALTRLQALASNDETFTPEQITQLKGLLTDAADQKSQEQAIQEDAQDGGGDFDSALNAAFDAINTQQTQHGGDGYVS